MRTGFASIPIMTARKGRELAENPHAALVFYWRELDRQVRSVGTVEKLLSGESDAYFASRPVGSQLAVWAERQSRVIAGRAPLEAGFARAERLYAEGDIPRPRDWGGYRLVPTLFEFWQGHPNRLHDRLCYTLQSDGSWEMTRLSP